MKGSHGQRRLFWEGRPQWSSWSEQQRGRTVDLLAELFVAHLDRLKPGVKKEERKQQQQERADA